MKFSCLLVSKDRFFTIRYIYIILARKGKISKTKSEFERLLIYRSKYMLITMHIILKWDSPKVFLISLKLHLLASFVCFALLRWVSVAKKMSNRRACDVWVEILPRKTRPTFQSWYISYIFSDIAGAVSFQNYVHSY